MARARSFGRLFFVIANQAGGSPLVDRCFTHETEGAMRHGSGFLVRLPFTGEHPTRGLVVGWWSQPPRDPAVGPEVGG